MSSEWRKQSCQVHLQNTNIRGGRSVWPLCCPWSCSWYLMHWCLLHPELCGPSRWTLWPPCSDWSNMFLSCLSITTVPLENKKAYFDFLLESLWNYRESWSHIKSSVLGHAVSLFALLLSRMPWASSWSSGAGLLCSKIPQIYWTIEPGL